MKNVFLFSGQGSHYLQMGRALYDSDACFRDWMQRMDRVVLARCGESVLNTLYEGKQDGKSSFARTLMSHPAIFMVEYALAQTLVDQGVRPDLLLGASLGSFAAAAVADCLEVETALLAVLEKAIALETHCGPGTMIAVMAPQEEFLTPELLALCELAANNFTAHSVISLPREHLLQVEGLLRGCGVRYQELDVSFAFHSRWIDGAMHPYQSFLKSVRARQASIPLVCCASGDILHTLPPNYLWDVARKPIQFRQTIAYLESLGSYRYIDVGPGGTLATFLKYGLSENSDSRTFALMSQFGRDMENVSSLVHALQPESAAASPSQRIQQDQKNHISENQKMKAVIFPGQGAQFKGMGKDLFPLYPDLVGRASDILGYSLEDLCLQDPQGRLYQTQFTQPALFVVNALHYYRQLSARTNDSASPVASFFAGHSLGEYNALLAAGVFSFETGVKLVKKRGELMGAANGGAMAAVIGVPARDVKAILDQHQLDQIDIANYNSPTQTVIAGSKDDIASASQVLSQKDIRCVVLNVSAAFHSRQMQAAQAEFGEFLQQFDFSEPAATVIANVTARPYERIRVAETLAKQIASPVQWVDSIRCLMGLGVVEFQEIGASVLSKMVQEIRAKESPIAPEFIPMKTPDAIAPGLQHASAPANSAQPIASVAPSTGNGPQVQAEKLGSPAFRSRYGLKYAYLAGAMYRGVASAELVIRMGQAGLLSFFGAGGLSLARIEENIVRIKAALNAGQPYGMNLLANYEYPAQEAAVVDLYLKHGIKTVEAAAFMQMTPSLVRFRLLGLHAGTDGAVICEHRIVAKVSRPEVAAAFMTPPPKAIVEKLLEQGLITSKQAELSQKIPVSHDICVEADSGGHTDGGIAAVMLPPLLKMRDDMQRVHRYADPICMGLAGGIGGPEAAAAAFLLGADFVMTGSINQCTVEAGMSADGKAMLQSIDIQDTEYAPAGDMFEIGAQVQVLKKSVFFPSRANKLLSLYRHYSSLDEIPERTRRQLEGTFFKKSFDEIWLETMAYFKSQKLDHEIAKAEANPKHKMALVFRWYFAYCTRIAMEGKGEDRVNYQIQTGPALGSFNQWVKGTTLEDWRNRHVDEIAMKLLDATAEHLTRSLSRFLSN